MPSRRTGPDDDNEPRQPDAEPLLAATPPAEPAPHTSPAEPATHTAPTSAAVTAVSLGAETWPLLWPGPMPSNVPAGHLEDPEWSRALIRLAAVSAPDGELPLAWRFGATDAAAFVETTTAPPSPFVPHVSGVGWSVAKDPRLLDSVSPQDVTPANACSGLVTMWRDDVSRCLLDIVAARSVALEGPPVAVGYTLSDVVVELATRRWSDVAELYLVGFGREMHGLENVRYIATVEAARALVAKDRFEAHGARCLIVAPLRTSEAGDADLRRLLRLVEQTPATGVICCDTAVQAHCTWFLAAHRQTIRMEVRGRTGASAVLEPGHWVERTGPELRLATRSIAAAVPFAGAVPRTPKASLAAEVNRRPVLSGIELRVLGPVQVAGASESFEGRPRLTELVVYLAFHPEGLAGDSFAAALWPEKRVPLQTLSNRLHEARRALGTTEDGRPRLIRADGRHLLAADVRTDWSRFVALTMPESGPASWRQALALVHGRPFEGLARGDWAVFEGFVATIEAAIVGVAVRLSEHLLEEDDPLGAEWAIRHGLLVAPWDERLYRLLMLAADAAGNRGGVESALRALAQALDCPGDPLEIVHRETAALYRRLTAARRP
jgi:DNA-binding SARP family transcriptional activator